MQIPQFENKEFIDQTILDNAMGLLKNSMQSDNNASFSQAGLIDPSSLTFTFNNNLIVTVDAPLPFRVVFGNGTLANAEGLVNGAISTSTNVDFSSLVPSSGTVTAYMVASAQTVQQGIYSIIGPPIGHPDYDPNFAPIQSYDEVDDSLNIIATLTAPDNITTFELGRTQLSSGQTAIISGNWITSNWIYATSLLNPTGVVAGTYTTPQFSVDNHGRLTSASNNTNIATQSGNNSFTGSNTYTQNMNANGGLTVPAGQILNLNGEISIFPVGTSIPFFNATAPPGWTQDISINDQVLRVVSGTGGATGGSWTVTGFSFASHSHYFDHQHDLPIGNANNVGNNAPLAPIGGDPWGIGQTITVFATNEYNNGNNINASSMRSSPITINDSGVSGPNTSSVGGTVTNDSTWRPAYINMIVCAKN